MRRPWYFLAVLVVGAATAAPAQAHLSLLARKDNAADNPRGLLVHVSGLLDDPEWLDQLVRGYTIQLHWTVQLWRPRLFGAAPQPRLEWDTEIEAKTTLVQYVYTTRVAGQPDDRRFFSTLDSLKAWLSTDVPLKGPPRLDPGDWYYTENVDVTALSPDDLDNRANGGGSAFGQLVQRLVLGGTKKASARGPRVNFTVVR